MTICKYKKCYDQLTIDELKAVVNRIEPSTDLNKLNKKSTVLLKVEEIYSTVPDVKLDDNPFFFFEANDESRTTVCIDPSSINQEEYNRSRPKNWNFGTLVQGPSGHIIEDNQSDHDETAYSVASNQSAIASLRSNSDRIDNLMTMFAQSTFREKFKIEYSESLGLPAFIQQVEEWGKMNSQDDEGKIRKACASLVMSKDGLP